MKLIIAIIRPEDLENVQDALEEAEASLISVSEIRYGRGQRTGCYRGTEYRAMQVRLRLEIVQLNDLLVPDAIEAIGRAISGPASSNPGEGDLLVMELDEAVRLRARQYEIEGNRTAPQPRAASPRTG